MEITPAHIDSFRRAGYVAIGPLVDAATLAGLRTAFESLEARWAVDLDVTVERYRAVVSQWTASGSSTPPLHADPPPRRRALARELLGADEVQRFHDH